MILYIFIECGLRIASWKPQFHDSSPAQQSKGYEGTQSPLKVGWTELVLIQESFKLVSSLLLRLARHVLNVLTENGFTETQLLHGENEEGLSFALDISIIDWGRVLAGKPLLSPVDWGGHFCRGSRVKVWWKIKGLEVRELFSPCVARCFRCCSGFGPVSGDGKSYGY